MIAKIYDVDSGRWAIRDCVAKCVTGDLFLRKQDDDMDAPAVFFCGPKSSSPHLNPVFHPDEVYIPMTWYNSAGAENHDGIRVSLVCLTMRDGRNLTIAFVSGKSFLMSDEGKTIERL